MVWLKRNLFLILFVIGTLAMTGLAVFFLLNRIAADKKATADLKKATDELSGLITRNPFPSAEAIQNANAEAARLAKLSAQVKPLLLVQSEMELENVAFKSLLENTIDKLNNDASELGIELPARYAFTFTAQRAMVKFPSNSILPLTIQLKEIREICNVLFEAKVHSLDALKRVRAYSAEAAGSSEYLDRKVTVTNAVSAVITPYHVAFKGFSSELTSVLEGFQKSPIFFVVKSLTVVSLDGGATGTMAPGQNILGGTPPTPPPGGAGQPTAGGAAQLETVLDEAPKKFLLDLEVVKTFAQ